MNSWFERIFRRETGDQPTTQKTGEQSLSGVDMGDEDDGWFDDWQGVSREGAREDEGGSSSDWEEDDNDDDDFSGGEMMPIPGLFAV